MNIRQQFRRFLYFLQGEPVGFTNTYGLDPKEFERQIELRQVGNMKNRSNAVVVIRFLLSLLIAVICREEVSTWLLVLWVAFCFMHTMASLKSTDDFFESPNSQRDMKFWKRRTAEMTFVSGLTWGFAGWFFLPEQSAIGQVSFIGIIAGVSFGSIPLYACWLPGMWTFLPAILVPPYLKMVSMYHVPIGSAILVAAVICSIVGYFGYRLNQIFTESIHRAIEREQLMEQLIQQRQKAEFAREASEMAIAQRTKFFAGVNHDLRQPLQAMGIFISILQNQNDQKNKAIIDSLAQACQSVSDLVDQILVISKLESKSMKVSRTVFDIKNLFEELRMEFTPLAEKKGIHFEVKAPSLALYTDQLLLARVLRNLLGNSFRYSESGTIMIRAKETRQATLVIDVSDQGKGMSKEEQKVIFKEFVRGAAGHQSKEGFGLGLSIVKKIVELLGIKMTLISKVGKGTIFHLIVPITTEAEQIKMLEETSSVSKLQTLNNAHILLIEDDSLIRSSMETLLTGWGAKVTSAEYFDAELTVRLLMSDRPDVILSDFNLGPGRLTGLQAIFRIRSALGTRIPAVVTTAVSRDVVVEQYEEETDGLDFSEKRSDIMQLPVIMQKPVTPAEINRVLSRLLGVKTSEQNN